MEPRTFFPLLERLCRVSSVSEEGNENKMAETIVSCLQEMPAFQCGQGKAELHDLPRDPYGRKWVSAYLPKGSGKKTVILLSHFDVVSAKAYGREESLAFDPAGYTEKLRKDPSGLDPEAEKDLLSGEWVFGRGVMDMKFGLAADMFLLEDAYEHPEPYDGNLLLISVPDEESMSEGMRGCVEWLEEFRDRNHLEYVCCIVSEPYFPEHPRDRHMYLYYGTIGKIMPAVLVRGKAAHAADPFEGINPDALIGLVTEKIDMEPSLRDSIEGYSAPCPVCLRESDTVSSYSVTTPDAAYVYFNFMTLQDTAADVMRLVCGKTREAVRQFEQERKDKFLRAGRKRGAEVHIPVYSWQMYLSRIQRKAGKEPLQQLQKKWESMRPDCDLRQLSVLAVQDVMRLEDSSRPCAVVFFVPPYYPARVQGRDSLPYHVCRHLVKYAERNFHAKWTPSPVFNGLSDMSYLGMEKAEDMRRYFPLPESLYSVPLASMKNLNIPFMNVGCIGRDAHQATERLNLDRSVKECLPMIREAVIACLGRGKMQIEE